MMFSPPGTTISPFSSTESSGKSDSNVAKGAIRIRCLTSTICDRRREQRWSVNGAPEFPFRNERRWAAAVRHHRLVRLRIMHLKSLFLSVASNLCHHALSVGASTLDELLEKTQVKAEHPSKLQTSNA